VLLLTQMGTPFLYAGEELGLADADVPPARRVDPGGRDGCRAPIPWTPAPGHGWAADPWLPWPPGSAAGRDAQSQGRDPESTLQLYRSLLSARRRSPALSQGGFEWLPAPAGVLAYRRSAGTDERLVAVNFEAHSAEWPLPHGAWDVEIGTHQPAITSVGGTSVGGARVEGGVGLQADEAVVLRPVSR
jgi:alpha-glucosidase